MITNVKVENDKVILTCGDNLEARTFKECWEATHFYKEEDNKSKILICSNCQSAVSEHDKKCARCGNCLTCEGGSCSI